MIMGIRFEENPIILTSDIKPSMEGMKVECVLNPGVFSFQNKTWLLLRVAERPHQEEGFISFPIIDESGNPEIITFNLSDPDLDLSDARMVMYKGKMYLSTLSHLRLVCSDNGKTFYEPNDIESKIFGHGSLETYGIEDCRVSYFNEQYYLTFTQVSENGVGVGLMRTTDWTHFERDGMIIPPHNKDCALFGEKINGKYYCLHRPSGIGLGGNFIWQASSPDMLHWGGHKCVMQTRPDSWDCARIGAGASPIKTDQGWLEIYHGADFNHRYCLGSVLFDLNDPSIVLARSVEPIFEPIQAYETNGFFGNVVFTNGHIVDGDQVHMYYGASDEVICGATFSISQLLATLLN
ncbi:MAG: glycoside hydrolase family 130 protein [Saprospiraceae bacterium]|nr:glycoside hydrolase family 130 protein [Saprospiraceae bacterium]